MKTVWRKIIGKTVEAERMAKKKRKKIKRYQRKNHLHR